MSAQVHQFQRRPDPVKARAEMALTDPTAIALKNMGSLSLGCVWLAARGYAIDGVACGAGRIHLGGGHFLRLHEQGPCILTRFKPGIFAQIKAENVGRFTGGNGIPVFVWRGVADSQPNVAIYWTVRGDQQCA